MHQILIAGAAQRISKRQQDSTRQSHPASRRVPFGNRYAHFSSVGIVRDLIPNLLVEGISAAIRRSPALKAYFVNLMWQPGGTMNFSASDHIRAIHQHAGGKLIDGAIVNVAPIQMAARKRYERQQALPVENDLDRIFKMGVRVVTGKLLQESKKVRHDPEQTAAVAMRLAHEGRRRRLGAGGRK